MKESVSIAPKPLVYQVFRHVANKVQYALAEYVDNSIASFEDHKDVLKRINPNGKLRVSLRIQEDYISIEDNAYGIDAENYQRAFELAQVPLDATGLNEFGMGMKVSSIWLSDHWIVESTAYGENLKKKFEFDLQEVIDCEKTHLDVDEEIIDINQHYTRITLTKLSSNKPSLRQIGYIKEHLRSIYSQYLRNGEVDIYVNGELLEYQEFKILNAPYYKDKTTGTNVEWKYSFDYDFGVQKAKGFIAILEKQSTSEQNGFLLFRRGRTIGTSSDDKYRPKSLCGNVGSPQFKRIFGEIEIEGFQVSFTKSSFTEDEQFQTFIEDLAKDIKDKIRKGEIIDIFGQAENYRKSDDPKKAEEKAVSTMTKKLEQPIKIEIAPSEEEATIVPEPEQQTTQELTSTPVLPQVLVEVPESELIQKPIEKQIFIGNDTYSVKILFIKSSKSSNFYTVESDVSAASFIVKLFMDNPFFQCYNDILKDDDSVGPVLHLIQAIVATELQMIPIGLSMAAKTYRDTLNRIIGKF